MKKKFIHATADAIYAATDPTRQPKFGFNMGTYRVDDGYCSTLYEDRTGHDCGTRLCIAGWMAVLSGCSSRKHGTIREAAKHAAGLTVAQSEELFTPDTPGADPLATLTPLQAVRVLRHFADTGKINWSLPAA